MEALPSVRAWPTSYSETSALEFHRLEIAIVSYIRIEYRRPFRGFSGFRMEVGRPGGRKNGREGGRRLGAGKREAETTKTKGAADKKFPHRYSAHSESLRECEQCRYIEYLFSFRSDASSRTVIREDRRHKWTELFFFVFSASLY